MSVTLRVGGDDFDGHTSCTYLWFAVVLGLHVRVRPYCWLLVFLKYMFTVFLKYTRAPGSHRGTREMAMAAPPHCIPLSVRKRELTEDTFHSARVAGADALAPSGDASARPPLGFLYRVSFNGSHEPHFLIHWGL